MVNMRDVSKSSFDYFFFWWSFRLFLCQSFLGFLSIWLPFFSLSFLHPVNLTFNPTSFLLFLSLSRLCWFIRWFFFNGQLYEVQVTTDEGSRYPCFRTFSTSVVSLALFKMFTFCKVWLRPLPHSWQSVAERMTGEVWAIVKETSRLKGNFGRLKKSVDNWNLCRSRGNWYWTSQLRNTAGTKQI